MIVDEFGNPVRLASGKFISAASNGGRERPYERVELADIDKLVPYNDHKTIVYVSRRLYANMGIVRGAIDQRAMFSVGRAWLPRFKGEDQAWGDEATRWLTDEWFNVCDVRGQSHDWQTGLYLDSVHIDRDGDIGILLTETEGGYPQIQRIPAHAIGQRLGDRKIDPKTGVLKSGPYAGLRISSGVVANKAGRAIAYQILGDAEDGSADTFIPSRDLIFLYDPSWHEQLRGTPALAHSLNDLRDMLQSQEWERLAQLVMSSIALLEYNEDGAADPGDPMNSLLGTDSNGDNLVSQTMLGGMIRYFKSNSGSKLEAMTNARPGDAWEQFWDRLTRSALAGMGWPYSMVWKATGQGTAERADLQRADRAVQDRQDLIRPAAKRMIGYAISKAIKAKRLPPYAGKDLGGFLKWDFTLPPRISIDLGRDANALIDGWRAGLQNHTSVVGGLGGDIESHYRERAYEIALRKTIAKEVSAQYGIEIEDHEMSMLAQMEVMDQDQNKQTPSKDDSKPDDSMGD